MSLSIDQCMLAACAACSLTAVLAGSAAAAPLVLDICVSYHCAAHRTVTIDAAQWNAVVALLRNSSSAEEERRRIAQAIAHMERVVGVQAGTSGDLPRNGGDGAAPGQLDCIAESLNTTTYLRAVEDAGLLRWHKAAEPAKRQRWVFNFHHSAVIREIATDEPYAVDSWHLGNGAEPLVQPLDDWYRAIGAPRD